MPVVWTILLAVSLAITGPAASAQPTPSIEIVTGFECAPEVPIETLGPAHFAIKLPVGRQNTGFFLFAVRNASGRTVRIDLHSDRARNWTTLNAVCAYVAPSNADGSPRSIDAMLADPLLHPMTLAPHRDHQTSGNRVALPARTDLERWEYLPDCRVDAKRGVYTIEHTFTGRPGDVAIIAMKFPFTPRLCDALMEQLAKRWEREESRRPHPTWEVVQVGRSKAGRPLWLVRIGTPGTTESQRQAKPCLVVYAREHADEHDSSWVAQGVIEYLLGPSPDAAAIRQRFLVLVIPLLDPDGAVANVYESITKTFVAGAESHEAIVWGRWFRAWVDQGHRCDVVLNLHNVESNEGPHLWCALYEGHAQGQQMCRDLDRQIISTVSQQNYRTRDCRARGYMGSRLAGALRFYFGSLPLLYEANSQAPERHLSLYELKAMGAYMIRAAASHMATKEGKAILLRADQFRDQRQALRDRYRSLLADLSLFGPFVAEHRLRGLPAEERRASAVSEPPDWLERIYADKATNATNIPAVFSAYPEE